MAPEDLLQKATLAKTAGMRAKYARRGLAQGSDLDPGTQSMLLRQLYLSLMERRCFDEAREVALEALASSELVDVAHQDVARACLGQKQPEAALRHLRLAGRFAPGSRLAFHAWTRGTVAFLAGHCDEAELALERAVRWGTRDKPLYRAQLALIQLESGRDTEDLEALRYDLEGAPCGQGYGQYVLGELAYRLGDYDAALASLSGFVARTTSGRVALAVALRGEVTRARRLIAELRRRKRRTP